MLSTCNLTLATPRSKLQLTVIRDNPGIWGSLALDSTKLWEKLGYGYLGLHQISIIGVINTYAWLKNSFVRVFFPDRLMENAFC